MGTIASTQTLDIGCDTFSNSVNVKGANVANNGLFRFRPRVQQHHLQSRAGHSHGFHVHEQRHVHRR